MRCRFAATLLPANLARLADLSAKESARYSLNSVHVVAAPDGTYRAEATDGRVAAVVTGPADDADDFPQLPALASAPNGKVEALVPVAEWKRAFKAVPGARVCRGKPILANVAAVFGEGVSTLATTDLDTQTVLQARNVEGRFPDIKAAALPKGAPVATVKLNADLLARLLKVAAEFTEDDSGGCVTLEVRKPDVPVVVRACRGEQDFTGVIMPLS